MYLYSFWWFQEPWIHSHAMIPWLSELPYQVFPSLCQSKSDCSFSLQDKLQRWFLLYLLLRKWQRSLTSLGHCFNDVNFCRDCLLTLSISRFQKQDKRMTWILSKETEVLQAPSSISPLNQAFKIFISCSSSSKLQRSPHLSKMKD